MICGGFGGGLASGGSSWLLGWRRERERERERGGRNQEEASFLAYFLPDFHHAQTMKSTPIYRG
jgi:hypothetical protein